MTAPGSHAYDLLGLRAGADRSAIDAAYRALMKRHHPDRGGDPAIAANINRAYAELTRPTPPVASEGSGADLGALLYARQRAAKADRKPARRPRLRWPLFLLGALMLVGVGWIERDALADAAWSLRWQFLQPRSSSPDGYRDSVAAVADSVGIDGAAIAPEDIGAALHDARLALRTGGLARAADLSALCYRQFTAVPSLRGYDRCVAFDNSILLIDRADAVDRGVFSAASLTARQLAAGRILDADYDVIETRLDRLRARTLQEIPEATPRP